MQKMGDTASVGAKRLRQQQGEEEDAEPAPLHLTALPTLPLPLLAVAQSYFCMRFSAQLCGFCDVQGASLFTFVRLPPHVRHPFAGVTAAACCLLLLLRLLAATAAAASCCCLLLYTAACC